jgi:hypothetical protein
MPVHFNLTGGYLISGRLEGMCEMYTCDEKGNGEIYIGNFIRGKLNDPNGTYMTYSNVSYVSYKGAFVDNRMDGQIEVIRVEFPEQETEDEKKCIGNSHCQTTGRKFIAASNSQAPVAGIRKVVIFSNGIQGGVLSEQPAQIVFSSEQTQLNNRNLFCKLSAMKIA